MGAESWLPEKVNTGLESKPEPNLDNFAIRIRPTVEKYVARRVRNKDHAEEIVSRVFEALARSWSTFRGDCPPDAYVIRIAANALKNYYERDLARQSRQISLDVWCEEFCLQQQTSAPGPDFEVHQRDEVESLIREMQKVCTPVECAVVELIYQGHTMDEIATLLALNSATVRSHFLRGRERLLAHLLLEAPDLLGGIDAIFAAVRRLETSAGSALTKEEADAILLRKGPIGVLRKAMLKLAPYLGVAAWLAAGVRR
jgi:RNA polymerase sigma factor (sigma-70 family)